MQENPLEKQFLNHPLFSKIQNLKEVELDSKLYLEDSVTLKTNSQAKKEILERIKTMEKRSF